MLIGKNVILDTIETEDMEWMRRMRNNPALRQYFREWKDITRDKQIKWYNSRGNNSAADHVYFAIRDPESINQPNNLTGCCGLHYIDWRLRSAEFGVFVNPKVRGGGIGTEALTMLFDYGFREMNLHKIWCEVYDGNISINLYRRLGFRDEGTLRDNYFCNGVYGNSIMMSVLEDEWFEAHPQKDGPAWNMDLDQEVGLMV